MHRFEQDAARIVCKEQMETLSALGFSLVPTTEDLHIVDWRGHGMMLSLRGDKVLSIETAMPMIVASAKKEGEKKVEDSIKTVFSFLRSR